MPKLLSCYWFSRSRSVCVCCTDFPHASRNASWWWCLCFQQETLMLVVVLLFQLQLLPGMMSHAPKICCNECFILIVCLLGQLVQVLKSVADCFNLQRWSPYIFFLARYNRKVILLTGSTKKTDFFKVTVFIHRVSFWILHWPTKNIRDGGPARNYELTGRSIKAQLPFVKD